MMSVTLTWMGVTLTWTSPHVSVWTLLWRQNYVLVDLSFCYCLVIGISSSSLTLSGWREQLAMTVTKSDGFWFG